MDNLSLWKLIREAWAALTQHFDPAIESVIENSGIDGRSWSLLLAALTFQPDATTPAHLMVRGPYTSADVYLSRLRSAASAGYLVETDPGQFQLSQNGREATLRFIEVARLAMAKADPLPLEASKRLAELFDVLVQASLKTPPPPGTWSIQLAARLLPDPNPPMPYIEQQISCLAGYRDDAHLAAWEDCGLTAVSSEVLTLIWRGEANSFEELIDKLAYRGHHSQVFGDALDELRGRHLITKENSRIQITDKGKEFRQSIEDDTDKYFFAPWQTLIDPQRQEMAELLQQMRSGLAQPL